jgi:hypothetical protein
VFVDVEYAERRREAQMRIDGAMSGCSVTRIGFYRSILPAMACGLRRARR